MNSKIAKEEIVAYFKELGDNIPDGKGYTPDDCMGYCPFIESCRTMGANLCDMIVYPEDY